MPEGGRGPSSGWPAVLFLLQRKQDPWEWGGVALAHRGSGMEAALALSLAAGGTDWPSGRPWVPMPGK